MSSCLTYSLYFPASRKWDVVKEIIRNSHWDANTKRLLDKGNVEIQIPDTFDPWDLEQVLEVEHTDFESAYDKLDIFDYSLWPAVSLDGDLCKCLWFQFEPLIPFEKLSLSSLSHKAISEYKASLKKYAKSETYGFLMPKFFSDYLQYFDQNLFYFGLNFYMTEWIQENLVKIDLYTYSRKIHEVFSVASFFKTYLVRLLENYNGYLWVTSDEDCLSSGHIDWAMSDFPKNKSINFNRPDFHHFLLSIINEINNR